METFQIIVLALIQGLTEYLPISSSAHLILPSQILGWPDQGLAFDVAVHGGSLLAVTTYFHRDLRAIATGTLTQCVQRQSNPEGRLGFYLMFATIPVGLAGLLLDDFIETHLRSTFVIATTTIVFGLLLALADKTGARNLGMAQLTLRITLVIGFAQALALIPGTSRSGITITAALAMGLDRESAARFSFLLAVPVIILSGGYKALQLASEASVAWQEIALGFLVSAITAFACIHFFLALVKKIGMMPFVWYRMILGLVLFGLIFNGV